MEPSSFSTSRQAGEVAARHAGQRTARILEILRTRGPSTLFEIAAEMNVFDHQISGRITQLVRDGLVVRTDQQRIKPETGCKADVLRLARPDDATHARDLAEQLHGHPQTLIIEQELWHRAEETILGPDDPPGVPYHRNATAGGAHLVWRTELLECPGCGGPLYLYIEKTAQGQERKSFPCKPCQKTWHLTLVNEPGKAQRLALLLKHL